jgi:AP-1 complex subunit gamma-1
LINYLLVADSEFRKELSNKICLICEKYAPTKKWHIDTVIKVLSMSGSSVHEEYISQIISVIATTPELHAYSVGKTFSLLSDNVN